MIVRGFKPVGWVAAVGAAAVGCYMLSLQVAAERSELAALERQIIRTRQDIRSLQTELGTRGRLQQLEQWNAEVHALSAPVAGQFLESNVSLARFDLRQPSLDDHARVRLAAAEAAPEPSNVAPASAAQAPVRLVSAPSPTTPLAANPIPASLVRRASLDTLPAPAPTAPRPPADEGGASGLLDEATLRDLGAQSRSERSGGARN